MGSQRRDRARRPARQLKPHKSPKRRLLVVAEGQCTEPQYILGYVRFLRSKGNLVDVTIPRERGEPKKLVEIAKAQRDRAAKEARRDGDRGLQFDEIWCVFDRDDHERFDEALSMAQGNGFELAVSNPCFELWLLLHLRESPGLQDRKSVPTMLRKYVLNDDKTLNFEEFAPFVQAAAEKARRLAADADNTGDNPYKNPTTGLYRLVDAITRDDHADS